MSSSFTLTPADPVLLVSATAETGATLTVYSDSATTTSVTLPAEVAAQTTYYLKSNTEPGHYADLVIKDGRGNALGAGGKFRVPVQTTASVNITPEPTFAVHLASDVANSGTAVLVGGTKAVTDANITANSVIRLSYKTIGGTPGAVYVSAKTAGTSFTITSTSGTDTSTIYYEILTY